MDAHTAVELVRDALLTALMIASPVLLVAIVIGFVVGLLQAVTQVQDQSLGFAAKLAAVGTALVLCLPWLLDRLISYAQLVISNIPNTISGG
jgi:flagellar biosynthetic protein FliQ